MTTLRIIYDNAINRASLMASSTAGSLTTDNMKRDAKSKVWRSTSTSATITATWGGAELISGVALPFCNLTATATLRIRGYTEISDSVPIFDTGNRIAVGYVGLGNWDWGALPLGVNAYSYGGGTYAVSWFEYKSVKKLLIDIVDTNNPAGYIECSRIVCGSAWSPAYNVPFGIPVTYADTSTQERSDAGDLVTTRGIRYKHISFDLTWMTSSDRQRFSSIMKGNGLPKPLFISIFPEDVDKEKEQTYQIYGKLSQISALNHPMHSMYSGTIDIEEN